MSHGWNQKRVVLGISGGIAAYKANEIVSRLRKAGAEVKVVMTEHAAHLTSPMTLGELSHNPVTTSMWSEIRAWDVEHIALATWADVFLIAPATANIIGKLANGIADDMLSTIAMAMTAPKFICPAMNTNMYLSPAVQRNLKTLEADGYQIMKPDSGLLACGVEGIGRLPSPESILEWVDGKLHQTQDLQGKKILVTAGGTQEAIDPVRFIGNHSSGKMGYALAEEAMRMGADVTLVTAPTKLPLPSGVRVIAVDSAESMKEAVEKEYDAVDAVIMAAAVSDFRVANRCDQKIKKKDQITLELVKNPDILKGLGEKKQHQKLVGFAAETQDVVAYAKEKLEKKNLDLIVANDVSASDAGFDVDTNRVVILSKNGEMDEISLRSKREVAHIILEKLIVQLQ